MTTFYQFLEIVSQEGVNKLMDWGKEHYPTVEFYLFEDPRTIHVSQIFVPPDMRNRGIGTELMNMVKEYAKSVSKPVVLSPEPERGKKAALYRFYDKLDFVRNKGRRKDYALSSMYGPTMYWKPDK